MNHWPFVIAAYGVTIIGTIAIVWTSYAAMRRAEAQADALMKDRA